MKRIIIALLMTFTVIGFAQKKKNGTIYSEHPAIDVVEAFVKADVAGDTDKALSYLADDVNFWNGNNTNKDAKPGKKENYSNRVKWRNENIAHYSVERTQGAYPDALEYKDGNNDDVVWVQTWDHVKGLHKNSGVKIDLPVHAMWVVNKDNKIQTVINYDNNDLWREMWQSDNVHENGTIYIHHEYINIVRRMMNSLEFNDLEGFWAPFDEKARFRNVNMAFEDESHSLEEEKEGFNAMREAFDITGIDQVGYPDYLHYARDDSHVVLSWWKLRMTRKSDNKKMIIPLHLSHTFNKDGKIVFESGYWSDALMNKK